MIPGEKQVSEQYQWYLEAVADGNREWMVTIESAPFTIGREEECNLKLIDKWISRRHSEIHVSGNHVWIRDLGSTNGTFVNNKKIEPSELLRPGDIISIGTFKFYLKRRAHDVKTIADETCSMKIAGGVDRLSSAAPRLRALLESRNVTPHFQPIFKFADMSATAYEVLGRVVDEHLPSNASELFELAEWLGCASDLSSLFREVGLHEGKKLTGSPLLFVNTTPLEIYHVSDFIESLEKLYEILPPKRIVLELNEKAITMPEDLIKIRNTLRKLEMGLAYDDFGSGQTRLAELAKVPPDFLKFDISLIHQIHLAPRRLHQMVSTFVKATQDLGIATIAEGIECQEEAETCKQLGFDYAQGFLYGRPQPIEKIVARS